MLGLCLTVSTIGRYRAQSFDALPGGKNRRPVTCVPRTTGTRAPHARHAKPTRPKTPA